ncbi:MAG TPA: hypothetical protein VLM36_13135 [Sphingomicrobium sp.]|nr:hypothetical protein [Sphingomicrobium sp.]
MAKRPFASRHLPVSLPDDFAGFVAFVVVALVVVVVVGFAVAVGGHLINLPLASLQGAADAFVVVVALVVVTLDLVVVAGLAAAVAAGGHLMNLPLASLHWVAAEAAAGRAIMAKAAIRETGKRMWILS